jgi:hypothetical protein
MRTIEQKRPEPKPEPPKKRATRFRVARALSLESLARDLRSGVSPGSSTQFYRHDPSLGAECGRVLYSLFE